jgi:hypothetical protein
MGFLLLGVDSLIVCMAIGPLVDRRSRLRLAALFGVADGLAFLIGAGLGWQLFSDGTSGILQSGILVTVGLYLLVVAAGTQQVAARWPVWVLPGALIFDNLTYGLVGDHAAGSLLQHAGEQAQSSALLALIGLLAVAAVRPVMEHRAAPNRVAGGALLLAATGLVLLG